MPRRSRISASPPLLAAVALALAGGCDATLSEFDGIYSRGADAFVLCGHTVDDKASIGLDEVGKALTRAKVDGTTVHLYAHKPRVTVDRSTIATVLAAAEQRAVTTVTYRELLEGERPGTLALSFDDHALDAWTALRPLFARYHARATFFVSAYLSLSEAERAQLQQLAADGHDIEYHSTNHLDAEAYVDAHGGDAYLADEILPALTAMRADGYDPVVFAYPFGARSEASDAALVGHFAALRAIRSTCPR
ncbi:MAG: polysaccharide deacetylase family protein [Kofleriaceae bacterium]